jgi:hypothetical protein
VRTTVNIDDALLHEAKSLALRSGRPLGEVVDDALRILFAKRADAGAKRTTFRLPTGGLGGLQPGVDLENKEQIAELLGDNEVR